jgi:hypothetical protein
VPYLTWVIFATILNFSIWYLNHWFERIQNQQPNRIIN